ncbi:MAG: sulfite exporter TauE/SafE family protein [Methyloceanibacter sp.]|nr:sulfite exporter TauE/SafE family protein [Methyloceanibacter sp.]
MVDVSWVAALLPLAIAGFVVGALVGLTGVGGGALMTPLLISSFGVPPQVAVGTDLLYAAVTKSFGGWRHHIADHIVWPVVLRLAAGSLPAALVLLAILTFVPMNTAAAANWIRFGLVFALPLSALAIVLYPWLIPTKEHETDGKLKDRTFVTVLFGVMLGLLVTLTSVGAGAIGVAVLAALYPLLPAKRIVGSDIAHAVPLTFVGGFGYLGLGHVDIGLLLALLLGSIPGIILGARLAGIVPEWILRPILAVTLCYAAYALFNRSH